MPAVANFEFPVPQYWKQYPLFIAVLLANFCGVKDAPLFLVAFVGFIMLFIMIGIGLFHLKRLLLFLSIPSAWRSQENQSQSSYQCILISFSLIFSINTAIGRISCELGNEYSRYIPYLIPRIFHYLLI